MGPETSTEQSSASADQLRVLTLNIWGLWLVSKKREERVRLLADYLSSCSEDVVLLQEVWVDGDAQALITAGRAAGLAHATHFRAGIFGSGLVTLSRHAILRHGFWRYAAAGYATSISCGDYYAGKGVGWVRLATPLGEVDVFNTHLHANYCHEYRPPHPTLLRAAAAAAAALAEGNGGARPPEPPAAAASDSGLPPWAGARIPDDDDAALRLAQVLELSELVDLINDGSGGRRHVVLGGDLNCKPDSLELDLLRLRLPGLHDAWAAARQRSDGSGDAGGGALPPNPDGFTCHAPGNSYQPRRQVAERIDYVWSSLACASAALALQRTPDGSGSYSDHFAVRVTLLRGGANGGAGGSGGTVGKLRSALLGGAKATATAAAGDAGGGGGGMPLPRQVATALATTMLLEEGLRNFGAGVAMLRGAGGFMLASIVYAAVGLRMFMPGLALRGVWLGLALLAAGGTGVLGVLLLLAGQVADRSQQRAVACAYRQLLVWMEGLSLAPPGGGGALAAVAAGRGLARGGGHRGSDDGDSGQR